jgi:hypothetical protein
VFAALQTPSAADTLPQQLGQERMSEESRKDPPSPGAEQRQQRLEQQLRANLQKRKAQARARRDGGGAADDAQETAQPLPRGPRSD